MRFSRLVAIVCALAVPGTALAEKAYGSGVSDTEIKIGQTVAYSGPLSFNGTIGRAMLAYFAKVNEEGGVNGRKLRLISLDDGFSPPKTVEQTRKLVEEEEVLFMFGSPGTATNLAVNKYLNAKKVPQLFIITGNPRLGDPSRAWTLPLHYSNDLEGAVLARHVLQSRPQAKIAILHQNDDFGKSLAAAFKRTLGDRASSMIVAEASFEIADPTVDQQVISLHASGADTLADFSSGKAVAQAIRKIHDIGWKPLHVVPYPASSIETTLRRAGLDKSIGLVSTTFLKDIHDPALAGDPDVVEYRAWMKKYYPEGSIDDQINVQARMTAQALVHLLKQCGDDLTRENVMREATRLDSVRLPLLYPGITLSTSPTEYFPIRQLQLVRFDGSRWRPTGALDGK